MVVKVDVDVACRIMEDDFPFHVLNRGTVAHTVNCRTDIIDVIYHYKPHNVYFCKGIHGKWLGYITKEKVGNCPGARTLQVVCKLR
jgi:hypothetical protein